MQDRLLKRCQGLKALRSCVPRDRYWRAKPCRACLTAARTMPGNCLMSSSSPRLVEARAVLYGILQRIQVDWLDKAARQPGGDSVHGQDLNSASVRASCLNARVMAGKPCVDDDGPAHVANVFVTAP